MIMNMLLLMMMMMMTTLIVNNDKLIMMLYYSSDISLSKVKDRAISPLHHRPDHNLGGNCSNSFVTYKLHYSYKLVIFFSTLWSKK